jgi:hypothetical protein
MRRKQNNPVKILTLILVMVFAMPILLFSADLKGATGTDIDKYAVKFNEGIINHLKSLNTAWDKSWNKYKISTFGASNTYTAWHLSPLNNAIFGISNAADLNTFKDSTFNKNGWLLDSELKGSINGNYSSMMIEWVDSVVAGVLERNKPMFASVMIGVNNSAHTQPVEWGGGCNNSHECNCAGACYPDTVQYGMIIEKLENAGVIPIINAIPPTTCSRLDGWKSGRDTLVLRFNLKLEVFAKNHNLPYLDIYRWGLAHGPSEDLNFDWTHSNSCVNGNSSFSDLCLSGGTNGYQSARNYLLLMALNDIVRYVFDGESFKPLSANKKEKQSSIDGALRNSPNPFNPTTTISFPNKSKNAKVLIYDLKGKEVFNKSAISSNTIRWDASAQANGIYFLNVITSGRILSSRLTLQK